MDIADFVTARDCELQQMAEQIAKLAAHIHAATYRLLQLVLEFDENDGWHGWKTCSHWLSWRTGISLEAAREKVRVARALPALPAIGQAFERGTISYSKVRAITRIATPETEELLLQIALRGTASHVEKTVRKFRRADPERENADSNRHHEGRYLHARHDEHGNLLIEGRLPAELGERVLKALEAATDAARADERKGEVTGGDSKREKGEATNGTSKAPAATATQRRADALALLADSALAAGLPGRRAADTHQVIVHVDAPVLANPREDGRSEFEHAGHVSAETSRRIACDASVVEIVEDPNGNALSVGRSRRTVPSALRRALTSRDPGCRFPGCEHTRFLEAHHIRHWANGGETSLGNLAHLCSFHHRALHEDGFRIEATEDGGLRFLSQFGVPIEDVPEVVDGVTVASLVRDQQWLGIDAKELSLWGGDPLDYRAAVDELLVASTGGGETVECARDGNPA